MNIFYSLVILIIIPGRSAYIHSYLALAFIMFGLLTTRTLISEKMFSQFTLKETRWINTFQELANRKDIIPIVHNNYLIAAQKLNNSLLNAISGSRQRNPLDPRKLPYYMAQPNHVLLADYLQIERFYHANKGIPLKIAEEKISFDMKAKFPIITSNFGDTWLPELKEW